MGTATITSPIPREPELFGQTVVVIGGSAGIGLETARRARAEGAKLILTARNRERLERAAGEIGALSTAAFDANDPASLERFFRDLPTPIDHVMVTGPGPHYWPLREIEYEQARLAISEHMGGTAGRRVGLGLGIVLAVTAAMPAPDRQSCARARARPRQPDRRWLCRHAAVGGDPRRPAGRAPRAAPHYAADPTRRRSGRHRRARRTHHDQHGTHRRDLRRRRRAAVRRRV